MSSLRNKAIHGIAWSTIERFSVQGIQFVIQIIMARILGPEDYGIIAILVVFLAIFQVFVDSGFSSALVQKHDRSEVDYSTVFYFNIGISIIFFLILFFMAPFVARFYEAPILIPVARVVAFNLLINAFAVVPRVRLMVLIDFKTQAKVSFIAVVIGGATGIWMVYAGYGIWALVFQSLLNNGINTFLLWALSRWMPLWVFSIGSFKSLFSFGSKILLSSLLGTIFGNLYALVIGRKFTVQELGFYSRADQFVQFPLASITNIITRVALPIMCEEQNNDFFLKSIFSKFLRLSIYFVFPLMIGFAVLAEPFIFLVLTERWAPMIPLLQILCLAYAWVPFHAINLLVLQAKGRSDFFLRAENLQRIISLAIFIFTIPLGIIAICIGRVVSSILTLYISTYYTKKILDIGLMQQIKDVAPSFILSFVMGGLVFLFTRIGFANILTLLGGIAIGLISYIVGSILLKLKAWNETCDMLRGIIKNEK